MAAKTKAANSGEYIIMSGGVSGRPKDSEGQFMHVAHYRGDRVKAEDIGSKERIQTLLDRGSIRPANQPEHIWRAEREEAAVQAGVVSAQPGVDIPTRSELAKVSDTGGTDQPVRVAEDEEDTEDIS